MVDVADIFEEIIQPGQGNFSAELSQYMLSCTFSPKQVARYEELSQRVQEMELTSEDRAELEAYVQANAILTLLKSKARRSLLNNISAA